MKHFAHLWVGCMAIAMLVSNGLQAQCTMACNDQVQVSLDQDGIAVVLPDMLLDGEDSNCPGDKIVDVMLPSGEMTGDTVTCEVINELLYVIVTDNATGNHCWGTILIEDKLRPTVACRDTAIYCSGDYSVDSIGYPIISDNCLSAEMDTVFNDHITLSGCSTPNSAIITRTWHVIDGSGNVSFPCVQTINMVRPTLVDVQFPLNLDNVEAPALSCSDPDTSIVRTGLPMVDSLPIGSLCKINFAYEDLTVAGCGLEFSVLRRWTVLDCCSGEVLTHDQLIKVEDIDAPVIDCPDTLIFSANGPDCDGTFLLPSLSVTDDCSDEISIRTIVLGSTIEGNGGIVFGLLKGTHEVTYQAMDECGNTANCVVVVEIVDNVAPVAICDKITQVSLTSGGTADVAAEVFDDGSYDACCNVEFLARRMDEPSEPFLPEVTLRCDDVGDSTQIVVKVLDCVGNDNLCMVTVLVNDKVAPILTCPDNITLNCTEWPSIPFSIAGYPTVIENCEVDTMFFIDVKNLNQCHTGTVNRTFTVVDEAGFSDQCQQQITLIDTTASTFIFPPDTLMDCSVPISELGAGEVTALGDCEQWGLNISDEIFPKPCGLKVFRTYTFLEWCSGMDTSYTQFIEVRDTNPPEWNVPSGSLDTFYVCPGDLVKPPPPTATDNCSEAIVNLVLDTTIFMGCINRYIRTLLYTATDTCGNEAKPFEIRLFVNDTVPPMANIPDLFFNCRDDIPTFDANDVDAFDNCPEPVVVELFSQEVIGDEGDCTGMILRTYRITDICGQTSDMTQRFIWNDLTPPIGTAETLGPFPCLEDVPAPDPNTVSATDDCKNTVTIQFLMDSTNVTDCNGIVWRMWRLEDECDNDTVITQILTVLDTVPPSFNCPNNISIPLANLSCEASVEIEVNAVDNCAGNSVTITNDRDNGGAIANGVFGAGFHTVTFYAVDNCGNGDSCIVNLTVTEVIDPSNSCSTFLEQLNSEGLTVLDINLLVVNGVIGGIDICTDVSYEINWDTLDCTTYNDFFVDSLMVAVIPYTLTVTDELGNSSTCNNEIILADPLDVCGDDSLVVGGLVFTEDLQPMPQVETQLIDGSDMSFSMTSEGGWYHFPAVPANATCQLKPYKNDGLRNGVTTYDLIKITQHILSEEVLDSPYKIIAADANNSGSVTTYDVVLIRKVILHVSNGFPNNTSWRFLKADHQFSDPANPFTEPLPEHAWITNISQDIYGHNFIGIKVGDVNGSASAGFSSDQLEDRTEEEGLLLAAENRFFAKGEIVEIPVFVENEIQLTGLQATIEYDAKKMTFQKSNLRT